MAFDSLGGGLARGIQTAMQFAGQRDYRETQARIAKLQGQLLEQQQLARQKLDPMIQKAMQTPDTFGVGSDFNMPLTVADLANVPQTEGLHISKHRPGELTMPGVGDVGRKEGDVLKALTDAYAQNFALFSRAGYDPTPLIKTIRGQRGQERIGRLLDQYLPDGNIQLGADGSISGMGGPGVSPGQALGDGFGRPAGELKFKVGEDGMLAIDIAPGQVYFQEHLGTDGRNYVHAYDRSGNHLGQKLKGSLETFTTDDGTEFKVMVSGREILSPENEPALQRESGAPGFTPQTALRGGEQRDVPPGGLMTKPGPFLKVPSDTEFKTFFNVDGKPATFKQRRMSRGELNEAGFHEAPPEVVTALQGYSDMIQVRDTTWKLWRKAMAPISGEQKKYSIPQGKLDEAKKLFGKNVPTQPTHTAILAGASDAVFDERGGWWQSVNDRIDLIVGDNMALRQYFDYVLPQAVRLARARGERGAMTEGDVARALRGLPFPGVEVDDAGSVKIFSFMQADSNENAWNKLHMLTEEFATQGPLLQWAQRFGKTREDMLAKVLSEMPANVSGGGQRANAMENLRLRIVNHPSKMDQAINAGFLDKNGNWTKRGLERAGQVEY